MARQPKYGPYNYERTLGGRDYKATAATTAFVNETIKRMRACALQSIQELIDYVQTPVAKGGKMRVDTGFLRASGQTSLTGMPSGPGIGRKRSPEDAPESILYEALSKAAAIAQLQDFQIGQTIYFGWTARYAKYREAYDGFLISGIQNWQSIVNRVCAKIAKRSPASRNTDQ